MLADIPLDVVRRFYAEEIRAALKGYTGTAQMVFNNRFFPATMRAKQLATEGLLGQPLTFRGAYLHAGCADVPGVAVQPGALACYLNGERLDGGAGLGPFVMGGRGVNTLVGRAGNHVESPCV